MKDIILKMLDNKWLIITLFTLLAGGNIGQAVYTSHNPEVLPEHKVFHVEPKLIRIPDATIKRICREAVSQHENGRWH